jgi:arginyl-tRNA--protein-N-Asp/Glu arginylyltransferase
MSKYLNWGELTLQEPSETDISIQYDKGYLFTRKSKGNMYQSRSLRIDLNKFSLNSENRRIIKKIPDLESKLIKLPLMEYDWHIHKLGKDFYANKFKDISFTASKIKQLITNSDKSNFNSIFKFSLKSEIVGYSIAYMNSSILHYAYPFYDFITYPNNLGMAMMLNAIIYAQENKLRYVYLGTISRISDVYKLQFSGLEWFDGQYWQNDIAKAKQILSNS